MLTESNYEERITILENQIGLFAAIVAEQAAVLDSLIAIVIKESNIENFNENLTKKHKEALQILNHEIT